MPYLFQVSIGPVQSFIRGDWVPKSSIDGQLECVIPKEAYPFAWSRIEKASGQERVRQKDRYLLSGKDFTSAFWRWPT